MKTIETIQIIKFVSNDEYWPVDTDFEAHKL